jgi:hypothetical protein
VWGVERRFAWIVPASLALWLRLFRSMKERSEPEAFKSRIDLNSWSCSDVHDFSSEAGSFEGIAVMRSSVQLAP